MSDYERIAPMARERLAQELLLRIADSHLVKMPRGNLAFAAVELADELMRQLAEKETP